MWLSQKSNIQVCCGFFLECLGNKFFSLFPTILPNFPITLVGKGVRKVTNKLGLKWAKLSSNWNWDLL